MKKLIYYILMSSILFLSLTYNVKADTVSLYYVQDTSSTKSTDWNPKGSSGYSWTYTNQYIKFNSTNERYITLSTCLTGTLNMSISSNLEGNISFLEYQNGNSCTVQGYNGVMYYYIFYINEFYDPQAQNEYYVRFNLLVENSENFRVVQDIFNVTSNYNKPDYTIKDDFNEVNNNLNDINSNINNTNDKLDNLNDNITNDNVSGVESAFNSFDNFLEENSTITQLITLPVTLYSAILNNVNGTCQPFDLGALYGENLILPCVNIGSYLGSTLWNMIDLIISGFAIYFISKKFIKIFDNFSALKEGDVIDD